MYAIKLSSDELSDLAGALANRICRVTENADKIELSGERAWAVPKLRAQIERLELLAYKLDEVKRCGK